MTRFLGLVAVLVLVPVCLQAQHPTTGPLEFGSASGQPGEIVEIPIHATFDSPLLLFFIPFQYDFGRLEFVEFSVQGTAAQGTNPAGLSARTFGPGDAICGVLNTGEPVDLYYRIPPGVRQTIGRLTLRIRADAQAGSAAVKPVVRVNGPAASVELFLWPPDGSPQVHQPEAFVGGTVAVAAPTGPRPVGNLQCVQFLDRAQLSFSLTESYDSLLIERDGFPIATLPGTETSFTDRLPRIGEIAYSVIAERGGKKSVAAGCDMFAVSPVAPSIEDFVCDNGWLSWKNPVAYDRLFVFRNRERIAELPGSTQSFVDQENTDSMTLYTVIGELEGYPGPETHCLDHGVWIMEVGDVEVPLDAEKFVVPLFVTNSAPVQGIGTCVQIDMARLQYVRDYKGAIEGTEGDPNPEMLATGGIGACGYPAGAVIYDFNPPPEPEKNLRVGLRQRVLNFIFSPKEPFQNGETLEISVFDGSMTVNNETQRGVVFVPGQVRFGSSGVGGVKNLAARAEAGAGGGAARGGGAAATDVALTWQNGSAYEAIRIERNGVTVAEIQGGQTAYRDAGVPQGVYTYKVRGVRSGKTSFPASAFLSTMSGPGTFLRGDANMDGTINIADPIRTLDFLFRGGADLPCADAADADDDGTLLITDSILTLHFLFWGDGVIRAPGTRYPWFDPTPDDLKCGK